MKPQDVTVLLDAGAIPPDKFAALFGPDDVVLLARMIQLIPDLDIATCATKIAQHTVQFPVVDVKGLEPLFAAEDAHAFADVHLTFEHAVRFIPEAFFPMNTLDDFVRRLVISLQRGRALHDLENAARAVKPDTGHEHLPSPVPFPAVNA